MKSDGTRTDKLEKLMIRIGIFSTLFVISSVIYIGCLAYEYMNFDDWMLQVNSIKFKIYLWFIFFLNILVESYDMQEVFHPLPSERWQREKRAKLLHIRSEIFIHHVHWYLFRCRMALFGKDNFELETLFRSDEGQRRNGKFRISFLRIYTLKYIYRNYFYILPKYLKVLNKSHAANFY